MDEATFAKTAPAALRTPEQPHEHQVNRMSHLNPNPSPSPNPNPNPNPTPTPNEHQVNRMSHELQQRQALCSQRDTLLVRPLLGLGIGLGVGVGLGLGLGLGMGFGLAAPAPKTRARLGAALLCITSAWVAVPESKVAP